MEVNPNQCGSIIAVFRPEVYVKLARTVGVNPVKKIKRLKALRSFLPKTDMVIETNRIINRIII